MSTSQNTSQKSSVQRCLSYSKIFVCPFKTPWLILEKYSCISAEDNFAIGKGRHEIEYVRKAAQLSGTYTKIRTLHSYYATRLFSGRVTEHTTESDEEIFIPGHGWISTTKKMTFLQKMLNRKPHLQAKVHNKYLTWEPRKNPNSRLFDIPKKHPAMKAKPEYVCPEVLSGGEWQKIAVARAFMKIKEADLLIWMSRRVHLIRKQNMKTLMEYRNNRTTIFIVFLPFFISGST